MFIANSLVFLELQKTGGSHICRLLEKYVEGCSDGKHNRISHDMLDKYVIGSIRNPWDWYVSLWAYGASGKGAIRYRTGQRVDFFYYNRMLPKDMGKNWLTPSEFFVSFYHDAIKPVDAWQATYRDVYDPEGFRKWIKLLLSPKNRFDFGEGYGFSPLAKHAGLMTYRYFRLFTMGNSIFKDPRLRSINGFSDYDDEMNVTKSIIRNEFLEEDFIQALQAANTGLTEEHITSIRNKEAGRTNASKRQSAAYYYDEETLALVAEKDRYLIEKFGYQPPSDDD